MPAYPQIKICGLTVPQEAAACAALGADAIGLVFYPPSPRHLDLDQAARITAALPAHVASVGVFVNPDWAMLAATIDHCRLDIVQLHGIESPEFTMRVQAQLGVKVLKALFATKAPNLSQAGYYAVTAYLVECGQGVLPGGNAVAWDWASAAGLARQHPMVLAGGLDPDNVAMAIQAALPAAVDASSGLESAPGRKDLKRVERFIAAVRQTQAYYGKKGVSPRFIFTTC